MKLQDYLRKCAAEPSALLAANFYNAETLFGILRAARECTRPVILQTSPSTIQYLGLNTCVGMARGASKDLGVTAWLHLDHARDPELIARCIEGGYDSVMIDASDESFQDNVEATRAVVERAHASGVLVEAELGKVPKLGESSATEDQLTRPEDAERFVQETGVDLLAVAIGSGHGLHRGPVCLDVGRAAAIRRRVPTPLVLHGGSGLSPEQWRDTIRSGIVKINFASEIKDTFMRRLKGLLDQNEEIDLRQVFPPAIESVTELVAEKIRVCTMED